MRIATLTKDKPERVFVQIHNAEASLDMPQGSPVCFVLNGTNDGNDAVLANTGTATLAHTAFAGIVPQVGGVKNGQYGMAQVFGICQKAVFLQRTRAATTDSWSTVAAIGAGCVLTIDTINNALAGTVAGAVSAYLAAFINGNAQASIAGSASSTNNANTAQTSLVKAFLRCM